MSIPPNLSQDKSLAPGAIPSGDVIPLCVPEIGGNEWAYIKQCLDTGWVSSVGSFVDRFESDLASYVNRQYGVATVNGTAALHIALLVAGVQADDEVLVSNLTFIAPANAIRYLGAWPVFIDADPQYWQMDAQKVCDFLEQECSWKQGELRNKTTGRRVKAIVPVHILGHPCDLTPILEVARKYDLVVIEDATESLGADYKGDKVGSLGDIACFSFNGNKIITTGGGGMIVTDNPAWARQAKHLTTQAKADPIEYVHDEVGYNYRLTNIQAAMGCAQLELLDQYVQKKRAIAAKYQQTLAQLPGMVVMSQASWAASVFWMYTVVVKNPPSQRDSRGLLQFLQGMKIQTRPLWCPMSMLPIFQDCQAYRIEHSPQLYRDALSLPCSVGLSEAEQDRVISALEQGMSY
jgi:perosamine synthetase